MTTPSAKSEASSASHAVAVVATSGFNYASVGEHATWLRGVTDSIRDFARRSALNLLRVGLQLAEVKARIKRYTFRGWLEAETPFSRSQAYRLMGAAKVFAPLVAGNANPLQIDPTAFYLLADLKVPDGARILAVELAGKRRVTIGDARQLIAACRGGEPEVKPEADRRYHALAKKLGVEDTPAPDKKPTPWGAVKILYRTCRVVHISRITQDGEQLASVTVYLDDDGVPVRNVARASLGEAVMAAAGLEEVRAAWKARNEQLVKVVM